MGKEETEGMRGKTEIKGEERKRWKEEKNDETEGEEKNEDEQEEAKETKTVKFQTSLVADLE